MGLVRPISIGPTVGELDEAVALYRQCVALDSQFFDGWQALGMALLKTGETKEAIGAGLMATNLRPNDLLAWTGLSQMWPHSWGNNARECPDGSYPLLPFILSGLGEMDGCYAVPGFNNAAENIISVGGIDHLVVQDVFRTGYSDYWALKLA